MGDRIRLPDGTALGDAQFVLDVLQPAPDDHVLFVAVQNLYGEGDETGLSLGDLRELVRLARIGSKVQDAIDRM